MQHRLATEAEYEALDRVLGPRIDGHLITYQTLLDELIEAHRQIGETMDFGLRQRTRWSAIWEVSGRCLGLCNVMLVQLRAGFASEVVPTMRSVHEAAELVTVVTGPGEIRLLRRWLSGSYISPASARAAVQRIDAPTIRQLRQQGVELQGNQHELGNAVYRALSGAAHNTRNGFLESVSADLRRFSYGPHPDPGQRAVHVEFGGQTMEEVAMRVGVAFATRFLGADFYRETITDLLRGVRAVRDEMPIDPPTVRGLRAQL